MIIREIGWVGETERNVILWDLQRHRDGHVQMQLQSCLVFSSGQMDSVHKFSLCTVAGREKPEGGTLTAKQLLRLPCQHAILCEPQWQDGFEQVENGQSM